MEWYAQMILLLVVVAATIKAVGLLVVIIPITKITMTLDYGIQVKSKI
jgi:hypothetical protein